MKAKPRLILLLLLLFSFKGFAQKTVAHQSLYWLRYYNQLAITEKMVWHNEIENRRYFENNQQHHLIMHSRLHYKIWPNADVALGFTYSLQSPHDPKSTSDLVVPELRPVQEINYSNPVSSRLTLQQRLRIDERFFRKNNGLELLDGYDFYFRIRYRLQANYRLSPKEQKYSTVLKVGNEIMINAGQAILYNQFDQFRISAALEQAFHKNLSAELSYIHWYQQRSTGNQFFDREILRLTFYHKIKL